MRNLYRYRDTQEAMFLEHQQISDVFKEIESSVDTYYIFTWFIKNIFYNLIMAALESHRHLLSQKDQPITFSFYLTRAISVSDASEIKYLPNLNLIQLKGYGYTSSLIERRINEALTEFLTFYQIGSSSPVDELENSNPKLKFATKYTITASPQSFIDAFYLELQRLEYLQPIIESYQSEYNIAKSTILPTDDKILLSLRKISKYFQQK